MPGPFDDLRTITPWPDVMPDLPFDGQGWCQPEHRPMLARRLSADTKVVLELGSWLGQSTRLLLELAPNATILCVDTWQGSTDMVGNADAASRLATGRLLEQFQRNQWEWRDRVIPLRCDSQVGVAHVYWDDIVPDLIFFDTEHTTEHLTAELDAAFAYFPTAKLYGDDWGWPTVRAAVEAFAAKHGFSIDAIGNAWSLER